MATSDCQSGATDPTHLFIKILPERLCRKLAFSGKQFGMAEMRGNAGFDTDAGVCFDRVMNLVSEWTAPLPPVLGAIIAHEAGHLLLGENSHSSAGIMRARW